MSDLEVLAVEGPEAVGGWRKNAAGLVVPEALSREREVWTRDEWKGVTRALKFLESKGITIFLGCPEATCLKAPLERRKLADGTLVLRCGHKDREFRKG